MMLRKSVRRPMQQPRRETMRAGTKQIQSMRRRGGGRSERCQGIEWVGLVLVTN